MKKMLILSTISLAMITACTNNQKTPDALSADNPFGKKSTLPYSTFDFSQLHNKHFAPAFELGIYQKLNEIDSIANNTEAATFDNTILALEKSGDLLSNAQLIFYTLLSANTNDTLQKLDEEFAPKFASLNDAIYLNGKLFERVETIYNQRENLSLDAESKHLVEYYYQQFNMAGAKLSNNDKEALKKLNEEEASLTSKFNTQLLNAGKAGALSIDNEAALEGLSDTEKAALKKEGKWVITLQNTTQQPLLQSLKNRKVRQQLFEASINRAEQNDANDTRKTITRLAALRAEKAKLLGFATYADWKLQDQMAKNGSNVLSFINRLIPATVEKGKTEAKDIQALINAQSDTFALEAWDWDFYAEQVRKQKFDLDESQIKPYFVLDSVLINGVFYAATELFGITFKERNDIPVYHPDVKVYEVFDADGSPLSLFYGDFFKRDNKNGGAWMSNIVNQSKLYGLKPVVYNVCNYTKPAEGNPALISFDDVTTLFHEFGHALHGIFANQQYPTLSGTNTPRDFVEFPSQFNEYWALHPKVLKNYARHYQTGESIPQALIDKIKNAGTFNQGYAFGEYLAAAALDLQWHTLAADAPQQNVNEFEKAALKKSGTDLSYIPPRYRSTYFLHIWANGYQSAYYAYSWAEMLGHDAYVWFEENGGLNRKNGDYFRDKILSRGNTEDFATLYKNFRGKEPSIEPLLKKRGLK